MMTATQRYFRASRRSSSSGQCCWTSATRPGMVRGHKQELKVSLERWCNEGRGSAKAIWQTIGAIGQGENQIAVIDVQLEGVSIS